MLNLTYEDISECILITNMIVDFKITNFKDLIIYCIDEFEKDFNKNSHNTPMIETVIKNPEYFKIFIDSNNKKLSANLIGHNMVQNV
ncbi:hypothetical protein [Anaerococcus lactolyticus]|nr:hypothetical protein [Anaerococcus lactolyticus]